MIRPKKVVKEDNQRTEGIYREAPEPATRARRLSGKGESPMNLTEAIFVVVSGAAAALTVIGTYTWWIYKRGQDSGKARAEREADQRARAEAAERVSTLEKQLAAIQAELDSSRPKRRRT